jgi:hypothetical protein
VGEKRKRYCKYNDSVLGNHFSKMKHVIINAICVCVCFFSFVAYPFFSEAYIYKIHRTSGKETGDHNALESRGRGPIEKVVTSVVTLSLDIIYT